MAGYYGGTTNQVIMRVTDIMLTFPGIFLPMAFAAALGREVAVRLAAPRDGRSSFRGILIAADEDSVTLDLGDGSATLPLPDIAKAHVVYNFDKVGGRRE